MDTICALSTPFGRSAIALIRVSGPHSKSIAVEMSGLELKHRGSEPAILRTRAGEVLDEVVVTFFGGPNSYTGEDLVEIGCHGNPKIVEQILSQIVSRGTRLAEPGEFTRRALANNKLSLDQVEALDLILNSSTEEGIRTGLRAKTEGLGHSVDQISSALMDLRVRVESQLDFSESEVGAYEPSEIIDSINSVTSRLEAWAKIYESHRHLFGRWVVSLTGRPNSGKSSLFNALIGSDKAIVFDQPGTTRDFLTHEFELNGAAITLIDTAGIRNNPDPIEGLGIAKSFEVMAQSDVICWVDENSLPPDDGLKSKFKDKAWILIGSKSDLGRSKPGPSIPVSAKSGAGIPDLKSKIAPPLAGAGAESDWAPLTSKRQFNQVMAGVAHLKEAKRLLAEGRFLDLAAQEVRLAADSVGALTSGHSNDKVITSIFARFCIGK